MEVADMENRGHDPGVAAPAGGQNLMEAPRVRARPVCHAMG